jgi:hypothetical protein
MTAPHPRFATSIPSEAEARFAPSNDLERAYLADYLATREQRAYDADVHARVSPDPVVWCFLHDEAVDDCTGCEKAHARYGISRRWGTR